jgi:hypothetical protein
LLSRLFDLLRMRGLLLMACELSATAIGAKLATRGGGTCARVHSGQCDRYSVLCKYTTHLLQ